MVLYRKIHLGIGNISLVYLYAFLVQQTFEREPDDDVFSSEESVYLFQSGIERRCDRIPVGNESVLQNKGRERLQVDLLKCYLTVELLRELPYKLVRDSGLNLWELEYKGTCKQQ